MKKYILLFSIYIGVVSIEAQQDPQYSQYMFNQLAINPAYAGSKDAVSIVADGRKQWWSMPGAPQTASLAMHGPLFNQSLGVGGHVIYESIGPARWTLAYADIAYRIKLRTGKLSFGVSAGMVNYNFNINEMTFKNSGEAFVNSYPGAKTVFDVGAGVYYYTKTFFIGASATHLTSPKLYNVSNTSSNSQAFFDLQPHLFLFTGKSFPIGENLVVSPSVLAKAVVNEWSMTQADINLNFLIVKRLWVGVSGRLGYGFGALLQAYVTDNIKVGYSYDLGLNKIGTNGKSTHEIMFGVDFRRFKAKTLSPRAMFI